MSGGEVARECPMVKEGEKKARAEGSKYGGESEQKGWEKRNGRAEMTGEARR